MSLQHNKFTPPHTRNPKARFQWWCRNIWLKKTRTQLKNKEFSIICNNCLGGMVTHDFLQPQLSPTVNLFIMPADYLRLLKNLEENLNTELVEVKCDKRYPVGVVNGAEINFMHYPSFEQAKCSWEKRVKRIKWDNMLVIFVERDGCTEEQLREFDGLNFKNKIAIVHKHYPNLKCELVVPVPSGASEVGKITDWANLFGKREYDVIDWVSVLNNFQK